MSYSLDVSQWKKGYTIETVEAGVQYMFNEQNVHRIAASVIPINHASIQVLERSKFQYEGLAKKYLNINQTLLA